MATGLTVAGSRAEHRGLGYWMDRVLHELDKVQEAPDADAVHDLRVAIRRCQSVAAVMKEVDPDRNWLRIRKLPRKLFRALGALRDTQVLEDWIRKLSPEGDPTRERLLSLFSGRRAESQKTALHAAAKFDQKSWKKLAAALERRSRLVPLDGLAAECLALERLEAAKELHTLALRTSKPEPWHALRIRVKKFRYTVESLLPTRYESWGRELKHVQDLLGEVHDLDVLAGTIHELDAGGPNAAAPPWVARIATERNERLETYRQLTLGRPSLWVDWRHGLPEEARLQKAALARLRVTARAIDKNLQRSNQVSGVAMRIFDSLARQHAAPAFTGEGVRRIMRAAASVHGIGSGLAEKPAQKAARDLLLRMDIPAGWTEESWHLMATIVRYHRGSQPQEKHKGFRKLNEKERAEVCACAGVLRLARVLRKCGVHSGRGLKLEKSVDALLLTVPGFIDTEQTASGVAAGKHLLETCIGCPLLLKSVPVASNVVEWKNTAELARSAAASD